jgi:hypothetical protein
MGELTENLREELSDTRRKVARFEGEAAAVEGRKTALESEVGLAKGRLDLKPKVDKFLEELQAEAHAKRVGDFERLLTALVQEVIPGEYPIGLDLHIDRGVPSLDIVSRPMPGESEDIFDDQGGALTNVVSMGLRMIAAVRSRTRKFLVFDEGDCWIENSRVPAFYKVLTDAATKVGVQAFVISHHDVSAFGERVSIARLCGDKDRGATIENAPRRHRWVEGEEGIASIRLRNFQSFVDETIHLSPGVNALTGRNNLGKSALVRALRAVFQGECRNGLIRRGERSCTVDVTFSDGRTLRWDRVSHRNPVNLWKLLGTDGAVVTEGGMTYETGGRTVPEWVTKMFGIGPVEGLDVHVNRQKAPVFLLDRPGTVRASVLSVGQESSHIRTMIQKWKEQATEDSAKVKNGEKEMGLLQAKLETFARLPAIKEALERASALLKEIDGRVSDIRKLEAAVLSVEGAKAREADAEVRAEVLSGLPPAPDAIVSAAREVVALSKTADTLEAARARRDLLVATGTVLADLPAAMPTIASSEPLIMLGVAIRDGHKHVVALQREGEALQRLPDAMPALVASKPLTDTVASLEAAAKRLTTTRTAEQKSERDLAACQRELDDLVAEMGNSCPVCGHEVHDAATLLGGHATHDHGAVDVAA